ncbi:MAG: tRNA (adenosine(37)-N6)-threonylcarbamoyltransferase complex ATPase subunit type 1 TsaE [Marinilabiliales bacterium]|nr:MAG: tRNA (adenosine(37)-N6)-threonylcarbamoyltransferase complex ATPase subunit type 1 TsaE [Marinilabiliales bacterium]
MNKLSIKVNNLNELPDAAAKILDFAGDYKVFAFEGKMGAGKTTLISTICRVLNVIDEASSPTFSIVNEYITETNESIFHFDFYRIKKIEEVYDIGFEEYIYSDSYCFMEWPELISDLLPEKYISVRISENDEGERIIEVDKSKN